MTERELIQKIYEQAQSIGACSLFKGDETLEELIRLFLSPQGVEFCHKNSFPSLRTLRAFKAFDVEKYGVYIDAGDIAIYDPDSVALIGHTVATVDCTSRNTLHHLFLYRGAGVVINAYGWSVTKVRSDKGCRIIKNINDNAIVIA